MANNSVDNVKIKTAEGETIRLNEISLESLVLLINTERLHSLEENTEKELKELTKRQDQVCDLHKTLSEINDRTDDKGKFKVKEDSNMEKMLKDAKKLGVKISETHGEFDSHDRERLIENIRMTIDDLNVKNDMQLQKVTRLTNERYESYQMVRSILKPLDDDKKNKARAISGR